MAGCALVTANQAFAHAAELHLEPGDGRKKRKRQAHPGQRRQALEPLQRPQGRRVIHHQKMSNPHIRSSVAIPSSPSPSLSVSAVKRHSARRERRAAGSALSTGTWS